MTTNTNALTFNGFCEALGLMAVENVQTVGGVVQGVSQTFTDLIPLALSYAENRIQRECPFLAAVSANTSYSLIAGSNLLTLSAQDFISVQDILISGTPLLPVSREWLQAVYGSNTILAQPAYFAMYGGDAATGGNTSLNVIVGPWPDANYDLTIVGTNYLPSLYKFANATDAGTQTTFLSRWMPDVLLTASMIYVSGFQRNFGSMASDPQMATSWEQQYQALMTGARVQEAQKQFAAAGWTSMAPQPVATPTR
jgi:hypothetical protein